MLKKPHCPVIAIEEHYSDAELTALFTGRDAFAPPRVMKALEDVGEARLRDMDESGGLVSRFEQTRGHLRAVVSWRRYWQTEEQKLCRRRLTTQTSASIGWSRLSLLASLR